MYLNDLEAERLAHCPTLAHARLYFAALRTQRADPIQPSRFFKAARVSPTRGLVILRELVRKGWIRKEAYGPPGSLRTVRYVSTAQRGQPIVGDQGQPIVGDQGQPIVGDQGQPIVGDRLGEGGNRSSAIGSSLIDPDLPSGKVVHKTEPSVRTGESAERGDDRRTDGSKKFVGFAATLVGSIVDAWQIPKPAVEKCVGRFFDELTGIEPAPTERELFRYVRAAFEHREQRHTHPAFSGVPYERFLGCACTLLRFGLWRDHERKQHATRERERERERSRELDNDERLTSSELLALLDERAKAVAQ